MKNTHLALCLGLLAIVIIGFVLFKGTLSTKDTKQMEEKIQTTQDSVLTDELNEISTSTNNTSQGDASPKTISNTDTSTAGVHVMPDGTVMSNSGEKVEGASVLKNGNVQLQNGTIVVPSADMRENTVSSNTQTKPNHVVVDVVGVDFEYDIKQIKVKKGDTVTINFKSNEGFHDWVVDEFKAATKRVSEKDGIVSVTFVADKVGTFQYYCSVMTHRQMGMIGYLIVEEK